MESRVGRLTRVQDLGRCRLRSAVSEPGSVEPQPLLELSYRPSRVRALAAGEAELLQGPGQLRHLEEAWLVVEASSDGGGQRRQEPRGPGLTQGLR